MNKKDDPTNTARYQPVIDKLKWTDTMQDLGLALIADYHAFRAGKISVKQAQAGAKLAEQALRSINLQLLGVKYLTEQAKQIESDK